MNLFKHGGSDLPGIHRASIHADPEQPGLRLLILSTTNGEQYSFSIESTGAMTLAHALIEAAHAMDAELKDEDNPNERTH
jgi:hypothetical protein